MIELAKDIRLRPVYVLGHLHVLWHAALEMQEDGDLSSWSDFVIAEKSDYHADAPKYVSLLQKHGWLGYRDSDKNLLPGSEKLIHDWLEYAGGYLKSKYRVNNPQKLQIIWGKHGLTFRPSKDGPPNRLSYLPNQDRVSYSEEFEKFWIHYPRKIEKQMAYRKYQATRKRGATAALLLTACQNYAVSAEKTEEGFIKHGATFLGPAEPWRDYLLGPRIPGGGSGGKGKPTGGEVYRKLMETKLEK